MTITLLDAQESTNSHTLFSMYGCSRSTWINAFILNFLEKLMWSHQLLLKYKRFSGKEALWNNQIKETYKKRKTINHNGNVKKFENIVNRRYRRQKSVTNANGLSQVDSLARYSLTVGFSKWRSYSFLEP